MDAPRLSILAVTSLAPMRAFAATCDAIATTTKKTEKLQLLTAYLKSLLPDDAARAALFLSGRAFPRWDERVLGVGGSTLSRLVNTLAGTNGDSLGAVYRKHGDLGDAAEESLRERSIAPDVIPYAGAEVAAEVTLAEVAAAFDAIASLRVQSQKAAVLHELFARSSPGGVKYLIKIITGDLRIGSKESPVEEAVAKAFDRPLAAVRRANMLLGDIGETLQRAFRDELANAHFRLFHPIDFMLATPAETPEEIFEGRTGAMFVEEKYDGIRAQAHKSGTRVRFFSRTLDEIVEFPELAAPLATLNGEFIVDGEILAWHGSQPLPFTQLQRRLGRKQADLWLSDQIPVVFMIFDLLYRDADLLLDMPLSERREHLRQMFPAQSREDLPPQPSAKGPLLRLAPVRICEDSKSLEEAFQSALASAHEGIVAKDPASLYTPGRRGQSWFKLKRPYATLDVVVTAVEYGHGKRHGVLSDYTFAVRDAERLRNVGKAYSGLTDAEIREFTRYFLDHTLEDQGYRRLVEPSIVLEVAFNNIQRSGRHDSGFALRFPRIVRLRPDKTADQIDTLDRVRELYARQSALPRSFDEAPAGSA
jgi:DNA ligase-1